MKKLILMSMILFSTAAFAQTSFYDFKLSDIDGKEYSFSRLKGKKVMIVNVASKCGFTNQYEQLEAVYKKYGGDKFVIIGVPANNFMSQEPGTNEEIKEFCTSKFGVSFPMMSKISVKGEDMHPLYQWLTRKDLNAHSDSEVKWNFQKYLIDENGKLVDVIGTREKPDSERIINWIKG
jgi:glutathione peroxidase